MVEHLKTFSDPLKMRPAWLRADGVRVMAGRDGIVYDNVGLIKVRPGAIIRGVDANLWRVLKACVDECRVQVFIYSGDSGKHNSQSRHYTGRAVDLSRVGVPGREWDPVTPKHPKALLLAAWFHEHGFGPGERRSGVSIPGLIFGAVHTKYNPTNLPHEDHLHVSVLTKAAG